MRIAVIGTGGIGGPYGASLAKAGADITHIPTAQNQTHWSLTGYASRS